jgi:hypothetical protein
LEWWHEMINVTWSNDEKNDREISSTVPVRRVYFCIPRSPQSHCICQVMFLREVGNCKVSQLLFCYPKKIQNRKIDDYRTIMISYFILMNDSQTQSTIENQCDLSGTNILLNVIWFLKEHGVSSTARHRMLTCNYSGLNQQYNPPVSSAYRCMRECMMVHCAEIAEISAAATPTTAIRASRVTTWGPSRASVQRCETTAEQECEGVWDACSAVW